MMKINIGIVEIRKNWEDCSAVKKESVTSEKWE